MDLTGKPRSNCNTMVLPSETSLYHGTTTALKGTIQCFPNDALTQRSQQTTGELC